jgi:Ca2+-transporting ATPase
LVRGLHTDVSAGLSVDESVLSGGSTDSSTLRPAETSVCSPLTKEGNPPNATKAARDLGSSKPAGKKPAEVFEDRIRVFKPNTLPEKKATPLWNVHAEAGRDIRVQSPNQRGQSTQRNEGGEGLRVE